MKGQAVTEAEKAWEEYARKRPGVPETYRVVFLAGRAAGLRAALEAEPAPDYQTVLDRRIADKWRERIAAKAKEGSA